MNRLSTLFICCLFFSICSLQVRAQSCCERPKAALSASATNDMASLAANHDFKMSHEEPLPFHYDNKMGETVSFATPDGKTASGYLLKAAKKSNKWLLVYQEWWGLNDYVRKQADTFYNDLGDVNVLAIDMYDGKVADKREDAAKYMQAATKERLAAIQEGALGFVGKKAKIASVGWCFGGMLSLQSAILGGKQVVGCVMYYGRPEDNVEKLQTLQTDVLGIFGSQDGGISPAMVATFEENMKKANKKVTIKMYDAVHAFANPSNPKYDKEKADDAYQNALNYLKNKFG